MTDDVRRELASKGARDRPRRSAGAPDELPGRADRPDGEHLDLTARTLSAIARDLRELAGAIRRTARVLRSGPATLPEPSLQALAALNREARQVLALAGGIEQLEALPAGTGQLDLQPIDLRAPVERALERWSARARSRGVALLQDLPASAVEVLAHPERIEQTIDGLISCALTATPRGGRMSVAVEAAREAARVVVQRDVRPSRARRRRPERLDRLSLGLAVSGALAEALGGTLEMSRSARSETLLLTLPSSGALEAAAPHPPPEPGRRSRLVVADDDPDTREALSEVLADDYEVVLAADGREACALAAAARPDLVLMDLYMPQLDGLAALETLREDARTADVPVIFISGRGDELTRSRSLDSGAVDFLQKPFSPRELKARIERTLRLTRRETQLQELARTDPLTGLSNLRAFRSRLEEEVKRARRYGTPLSCVMVDMDRLKPINDEMGHAAGDAAIAAVAEVMRRELRETDFGARYGGDEFVLLLPHTSGAEARVFAERVAARLRESDLRLGERRIPLSASFGIASLHDGYPEETEENLVQRADEALYAAKRAGRGCVAEHAGMEATPVGPAA
jgi:two-component system cell cycle response regulator